MILRKKIRSDNGAAVTILSLALLVLFMFISVFMVDFVKNTQIKNNYISVGQRATRAALIHQNGVGGLLPQESAEAFINEYMIQTRNRVPSKMNTSNDSAYPGQTTDTAAFRNNACSVKQANKYPVIKLTYSKERTSNSNLVGRPTVTSVGGSAPMWGNNNYVNDFANNRYRVVSATITDISDNYFFGMFGQPCQTYTVKVSSIATQDKKFDK